MQNKTLYCSLKNIKHIKNDYKMYDDKRNNYGNKKYN